MEYDSSGSSVGVNVYGKGVDEILERVAIGADGQWHTYYLHQNHEGSVTLLTDTSGNVLERYRYDVFGAPTIYAPNWISRSATLYDNRFLFTGSEPSEWGHREMDGQAREGNGQDERERTSQYAATYRSTYTTAAFNFYEYRARAYNAKLGRFMSEDPKLFVRRAALAKAAGDWSFATHPDEAEINLFRYCDNDPVDFTDPMGLWDMGDIKEFAYSLWYAGPRATWDARPFVGNTSGKFAVEQGFKATREYGNNPNAGAAVRHEVWQAELARKWGDKAAKAIGDAHEKYKSRDPADSGRDQYHNELGRKNAKTSQSREASLQMAKRDWESGRAARDKFDPRLERSGGNKSEPSTQKPPDASSAEQKAIQQGTNNAAQSISEMEHGLNIKPQ